MGKNAGEFDAVVVGAGFAGLYMLHRLRGLGLKVRVYEAGSGIGGTWFWNRYPGARCDVDSLEYSYQFDEELQNEWVWSERYASQPEILRYLEHVADRFELRSGIVLNTRVEAATYDEQKRHWDVKTSDGSVTARFCILASGCLSVPNTPELPGLDSFEGECLHTGTWPHRAVDFSGKRVGMIGTGSSGIQSAPLIAEQAKHLTVFQRTATYSVPAYNGPVEPEREAKVRADYPAFRARNKLMSAGIGSDWPTGEDFASQVSAEVREARFEDRWARGGLQFLGAFADLLIDKKSSDAVAEFLRAKIRAVVDDPAVAELLSPDTIPGCKRLCVDSDYHVTFNRPNVTLVDLRQSPIEAITPGGLTAGGKQYELDAIVLATGFDAMTGAIARIDIRGKGDQVLLDKWAEGPRAFLGLVTAGFPNLFFITGPGSPSVLSNMVPSIEQHVEWIADCIAYMGERDLSEIDTTVEEEEAWVKLVSDIAAFTLFGSCNSWYLGANIPGKPRVFMPYLGVPAYNDKCKQVVADGYAGFVLDGGVKPG